jgi:hypothetical protein
MASRRERLRFLIRKVDELADQIQQEEREAEVMALAEQLEREPDSVTPIGDTEWETLLPKERQQKLPHYYLTLRSELIALDHEGARVPRERRTSWLDGSAVKTLNVAVGVATLVQFGAEVLHVAGVFAHDEEAFGDPLGVLKIVYDEKAGSDPLI